MAKKFIDIENLRILWNEINDKFVRSSQLEEQLDILSPITLTSTPSIQLRPDQEWEIDESYYNTFINFINSNNSQKIIIDADNIQWDIICKTFFSTIYNQFEGIILSTNDIDSDDDNRFWYIRTIREIVDDGANAETHYRLVWSQYSSTGLSDILNEFVKSSDYIQDIKSLSSTISIMNSELSSLTRTVKENSNTIMRLSNRVEKLEQRLGVEPDTESQEKVYTIRCYLRDEYGEQLDGVGIEKDSIISISQL